MLGYCNQPSLVALPVNLSVSPEMAVLPSLPPAQGIDELVLGKLLISKFDFHVALWIQMKRQTRPECMVPLRIELVHLEKRCFRIIWNLQIAV